ncbi:MAG: DNA polymerase III subunit gamma and tau [Cryobacterium sp.]|nr:DNA polymerase III subunit gamma and tau [Cryobacterium sp.]
MATALYRRYRPETFSELIGQSQVTEPLMTALRTNRVNHAYLFSGPRGCGKTTSARILARCLNCVEGPTDTPCGKCASCIELARDGGGSLDVVEIDAASHNGVDDARDLRERAIYAPARDRYKIFILDEAHMVTNQGFNALLKIVEEPPEHIKFIFATTEPEKVIGTIRSRTHHYPFRLVPPALLGEYVHDLCKSENVELESGVVSLVVRAGGGSVRDTLSLLDQLIAGSEGKVVSYERAVALLGYTHSALLAEVVDSLIRADAAAAFLALDRVIESGQDPRRFVEDLLQRLRDLIVVAAFSADPRAVTEAFKGTSEEETNQLISEATGLGVAELSRMADVASDALAEMAGATSPRLQLELMIARMLVPATDDSSRGTIARVERLERRIGVNIQTPETAVDDAKESSPQTAVNDERTPSSGQIASEPSDVPFAQPAASVSLRQVQDSWEEILDILGKQKRTAWAVAYTAKPVGFKDGVLALAFPSANDVEAFKKPQGAEQGVSDLLRGAIEAVLGVKVKFIARSLSESSNSIDQVDESGSSDSSTPNQTQPISEASKPALRGEAALRQIMKAKPIEGSNSARKPQSKES